MSQDTGVLAQTWREEIERHLREWGPMPKAVVIARLAPLMPPGYAWQRYVIDGKLRQRLEAKGEWEEGDPFPEPQTLDDYAKAQRALVLWFLRQMRSAGRLTELGGSIALKED